MQPSLGGSLEGVLHANMEINHERGKHEFQKRVDSMQKAVKGSQCDRCAAGLNTSRPDWNRRVEGLRRRSLGREELWMKERLDKHEGKLKGGTAEKKKWE